MEIAEQLAVVGIQILFPVLAFNQDNGLSVLVDGIVYLFAFLIPRSQVNSGTTSVGSNTS